MNTVKKIILAVALAHCSSVVCAQDNLNRTIDPGFTQFWYQEGLAGANRDIAIAFLHGFLLGKSGSQNFNLDDLHKQTTNFIEHCLSNPDGKAVDSMTAVKK